MGIPDSILLKPGKLTKTEFGTMKEHTEIGARVLEGSNIALLRNAQDIALCHHEKWDGSGYPTGLSDSSIPESARIVAICDVYDALQSDRPYRPAFSEEEALTVMDADKDVHFDPRIYDCFVDVLPELRRIREEILDYS